MAFIMAGDVAIGMLMKAIHGEEAKVIHNVISHSLVCEAWCINLSLDDSTISSFPGML